MQKYRDMSLKGGFLPMLPYHRLRSFFDDPDGVCVYISVAIRCHGRVLVGFIETNHLRKRIRMRSEQVRFRGYVLSHNQWEQYS